jgi:hypothetical protein
MVNRMVPSLLAAVAVALFVSAAALADENARFKAHEGKVVSATDTKLIMADKDGKEHTHMLAKDVKIMLDSKKATAQDLKPGMRIRVTTPKDDLKTAVRVEALDKDKTFPKLDFKDLEPKP